MVDLTYDDSKDLELSDYEFINLKLDPVPIGIISNREDLDNYVDKLLNALKK